MRRPRALRAIRLVLAGTAISLSFAGCTSGHTVLGTTVNPCFKALPAATTAVHRQGVFIGVRSDRADTLIKQAPRLASVPEMASLGRQTVCVVAYRGEYQPGQVDKATSTHPGHYAVVIVKASDSQVVVSFILRHLPLRFRHLGPF